jgi:hypothetical protein
MVPVAQASARAFFDPLQTKAAQAEACATKIYISRKTPGNLIR